MITFLLRRRSYLKTLGSVIDAALCQGQEVRFSCPPGADVKEPFRPGDFARWHGHVTWGEPVGQTIGLTTDPQAQIGVSQFYDNLLSPPIPNQRICYLSEYHREFHAMLWPPWAKQILAQPIVGWTMGDHRALITSPRIKGNYAVLYTMKRNVPEPWRRSWIGRMTYARLILNYCKAAQNFGWDIVAKTRRKHGDPFWLRHIMDVVGEESVYPATSSVLAAYAKCGIHFESGAGVEMRWYGCPEVCLRVPKGHIATLPGVEHLYHDLFGSSLSNAEYVSRYLGFNDTKAGERVMEVARCL